MSGSFNLGAFQVLFRQSRDMSDIANQLLKKLDADIQKTTGVDYKDKPINLHKIENKLKISIKQPKRNAHGKLGYHKHKLYSFISPEEREKTNRKLDKDFGIKKGEFQYISEE